MVKLQSTIALVQGVGGLKDLIEELPVLGNWFKKLVDFINPFNARLEETANRINSIDISKLSSPKEIPQGSTIAASGGWSNPANPQYSQNVQKSTNATSAYVNEGKNLNKQLKDLNIAYALQSEAVTNLQYKQAQYKGTIQGLNKVEGLLIDKLNIPDVDLTQEKLYSLSQESKDKIKSVSKDTKIILYNMDEIFWKICSIV